ncbi:hypothetical protein [Roseivirga sp. E12]|uniref:hypothetical protein n=1 Tax=Roseivirga sp. E12 TaxID=2819237 RepID=UPI001ABCD185|nr:hypothetical protein [Roseivirga sp. E12]MBO3697921.1 hypothetical protein [Roseivirga sp. E12]
MNPQFRPTEQHTLHFDFSYVKQDVNFTFHHSFKDFPVKKHTPESIVKAKETHPSLRYINDDRLTHFIDVDLPADVICLTHVTYPRQTSNGVTNQITQMGIHTPQKGKRKFYDRQKSRGAKTWEVHPKIKLYDRVSELANNAALENEEDTQYPYDVSDWQGAVDTSIALLFQHNALINLSTENDQLTPNLITDYITQAINNTSLDFPFAIYDAGEDWCTMTPAVDPNGNQLLNESGEVVYTMELSPDVKSAMEAPLKLAVKYCADEEELEGQTWNSVEGATSDSYNADANVTNSESPGAMQPVSKEVTLTNESANNNPYNWVISNHSKGHGLSVDSKVEWKNASGSKTWKGSGLWSDLDTQIPLNDNIVAALLREEVYIKVCTADHESGLIGGYLKIVGEIDEDLPVNFEVELSSSWTEEDPIETEATLSGSFILNEVRTSMSYSINASNLDNNSATAMLCMDNSNIEFPLRFSNDGGFGGSIKVKVTNEWLRHLSAYVTFLDEDDKPITFDKKNDQTLASVAEVDSPEAQWPEQMAEYLGDVFEPAPDKKYLQLIQPVTEVFGIPLGGDPTTLTIPVPDEAHTVKLLFGGLGTGKIDNDVCWVGILATCLVELALPVILLAAGNSNSDTEDTNSIMNDPEMVFAMCAAGGFLVTTATATYIATSQDSEVATKDVISVLSPLLLNQACTLGKWMAKRMAEGAAERCIPFIDAAKAAFDAAVTAAQLAQTSIEVASSPFVFEMEAVRAIDLQMTLVADKDYKKFPDQATKYLVSVVYDKSVINPKETFELPAGKPLSDDIIVNFENVPAGGKLRVYVFFLSDNNWQAGQGCTDWLEAKGTDGSTLVIPELEIETNLVPLSASSVYEHKSKIAFSEGEGHFWQAAEGQPPTATLHTDSPYAPTKVTKWNSITMSQSPAMMAYDWMASNLPGADNSSNAYTVQNLSTLQHPEQQFSMLEKPTNKEGGVLYDMAGPDDGSGLNFFIDPTAGEFNPETNPGGGYHLRKVSLKYVKYESSEEVVPPEFSTDTNESWGRFPVEIDKFVKHPQGYVFGISYSLHKLFYLELPDKAMADKDAPMANSTAGEGFREGLVNGPRGIELGLDGVILILEAVNNRVQAFDTQGKPIPYFTDPNDESAKVSTMNLANADGATYLDMAVEGVGYIYVLRHDADGSDPNSYAVDVYKPDGSFLVTTTGVSAAKITVSLLRAIYALNYEVIMGDKGRIEPSVSLWVAPAPDPE